MKMTRNILRRMELRIYQAITSEQMKKHSMTETQQKLNMNKTAEDGSSK
jgi:hypothetical protein